jgi:uncharacterized Zn-finger protein
MQHNDNHEIAVQTTGNVFLEPIKPFDRNPNQKRLHQWEIEQHLYSKDTTNFYVDPKYRGLCTRLNTQVK